MIASNSPTGLQDARLAARAAVASNDLMLASPLSFRPSYEPFNFIKTPQAAQRRPSLRAEISSFSDVARAPRSKSTGMLRSPSAPSGPSTPSVFSTEAVASLEAGLRSGGMPLEAEQLRNELTQQLLFNSPAFGRRLAPRSPSKAALAPITTPSATALHNPKTRLPSNRSEAAILSLELSHRLQVEP